MDRKTVRKYVAPAVAAGLTPAGPAVSAAEWSELVRAWFPSLASRAGPVVDDDGEPWSNL